ncbi:MAG: alpha-L-fucosidase [Chitinophagaceae bacterium]|nr:alpha-L-fucosidase [Chitinophagaceae bacterium]MBL0132215.1 alpha-L-fucosidase [Chitinophagaceae bacterium]MBL0271760.1 alpha-L-fucosidase [Chitinophagaceae bacterium]
MKRIYLGLLIFTGLIGSAQNVNQFPIPTKQQLAWHETEYYLFLHFGPNTFTDNEWGSGTEPEDVFNPSQLDCRQWCNVAKEAGAKGIIITAKHHDGFCLWPSNFSKHTVRESKWKEGKGDVLKELSQACKEAGLKFGVYLSPWDRNHPDYGTEKYNTVFAGMMKEIFQNYGPIWEMWWDGANGEGPDGKKQVYDWKRFENIVKQYSPKTVVFSDIGPDIRWTGNENGIAGDPNWNFLNIEGFKRGEGAPPTDTLNHGNYMGRRWIPAECDVSIRPGWFWHAQEDSKVKTPQQLFNIYLKSVGRGANLLLNVPPDSRGLISEKDAQTLVAFKKLREESFDENLLKSANIYYQFSPKDVTFRSVDSNGAFGANLQNFIVELPEKTKINCLVIREAIHLGQSVRKFTIEFYRENKIIGEIKGTSVGKKRILTFPTKNITSFRVYLEDAKGIDNISGVAGYYIDEKLVEK